MNEDDAVSAQPKALPTALVGDGELVPCVGGDARPYLNLDAAASTERAARRGARVCGVPAQLLERASRRWVPIAPGDRRRTSEARQTALAFAGRDDRDGDVAIFCRNTTEAINHLAYRLRLERRRRRGRRR